MNGNMAASFVDMVSGFSVDSCSGDLEEEQIELVD